MTEAELRRYHPANNYVLLTPAVRTDKINHGSLELIAPLGAEGKAYDIFKSQPVVCTVVSPPRRLIYGKRRIPYESIAEIEGLTQEQRIWLHKSRREAKFSEITMIDAPIPMSMQWKTTIHVKAGDVVWVSSLALVKADEQNMAPEIGGTKYYLLSYEDLYMKKISDGVQMLNGWVLADVIHDTENWMKQAEKSGLVIPGSIRKDYQQYNDRLGVVKYIGDPVEYLFEDGGYDHPEIQAGDVVMFKWRVNRRLEPGQKFFAKDGDLTVTRRNNIMAIME